MPQESIQPFDKTQRSGADPELVEGVLGSGAREDMEELVDGVQQETSQGDTGELELSELEAVRVGRSEKEKAPVDPETRKEQYQEWAKELGFISWETWPDKFFNFLENGWVELKVSGFFQDKGIESLPPSLKYMSGKILNLSGNNMSSFDSIPFGRYKLIIEGNKLTSFVGRPGGVDSINAANNQITSCRGLKEIMTGLDISGNPIESLDDLPKEIDELRACNIPATTIPAGLKIKKIILEPEQTELIKDAKVKGYNVVS